MSKKDKTGDFSDFLLLAEAIDKDSSYTAKTLIIQNFLKKFKGDLYLLCKLLLCKEDKRVYNIKDKSLVKLLSRSWNCSQAEMITDLEQGDASETARKFCKKYGTPAKESSITLGQLDTWLDKLTKVTKEDDQLNVWNEILSIVTPDDLRMIYRIIDHDLRINIGAKFVLGALHESAFEAYKKSSDLRLVIDRVINHKLNKGKTQKNEDDDGDDGEDDGGDGKGKMKRTESFSTGVTIMTPIKPMLARPCKTVEEISQRCPNGVYAEIKYDGERVQIHKSGKTFKCFSRHLKAVMKYKIDAVEEFIPQSTTADTIILDSEVLLMDTKTRRPLPFGSLGVHRQANFTDATVCLFVFDILYLNGKSLLDLPIKERRKLLEKHVNVIPNRVEISELTICHPKTKLQLKKKNEDAQDIAEDGSDAALKKLMAKVLSEGLEGLVVKDALSNYEPNARHWLKIKKDYLSGLADSTDLICLGGYFGSGNYGGMISVFLMGVYDKKEDSFLTVCKVGNGFDEKTIKNFQETLVKKMVKIEKDPARVPSWLKIHRTLIPDYIAKDPKKMDVFEVVGAEFTESKVHTADSISIRFPRVIRERKDKTWKEATDLVYLKDLVKSSVRYTNIITGGGNYNNTSNNNNNNNNNNNVNNNNNDNDDDDENEDDENRASSSNSNNNKNKNKNNNNNNNNNNSNNNNNNNTNKNKGKQNKGKQNNNDDSDEDNNGNGNKDEFGSDDDDDNSSKSATKKHTESNNDKGKDKDTKPTGIIEVLGDVTEPQGDPGNKVVVICSDDTGRWGTKGIFAAIRNRWPSYVDHFENRKPALGTCDFLKVDKDDYLGTQYVATVIGQKVSNLISISEFNPKSFESAITQLSAFASQKKCSVHLARLSPMIPKLDWDKVEKALMKHLVSKGITTYVYSLQPVTPQAKPAPAGKKKKEKEKEKEKDSKKKTKANVKSDSESEEEVQQQQQPAKKQKKNDTNSGKPFELPSVFKGVTAYIHKTAENYNELIRYFVAYDGSIETSVSEDITHIIVQTSDIDSEIQEHVKENTKVFVVDPMWAWDSINTTKRRNESSYLCDMDQ